ncbi:MAG: phenylalanine--tRNA ligase subunit beta [Candidatus Nanoarchaeia archaeon]|jgi:phenylalanyl-tRNA synthetase beta chain
MPVINFSYKDFCKLVGRKYTLRELEDTMPMMGLEWEGVNGDDVSVELFPNRPDLLSVEGLARAYRSFRGIKTGLVDYSTHKSGYELIVDDSVREVRPFVAAAVVKSVHFTEASVKSLMQLQEKLHMTHCRNRVKAAIGVHDLRVIKFPVRYAALEPDSIHFIPLDSTKEMTPSQVLREHAKGIKFADLVNKFTAYPMIIGADNEVLSFPPIINSELTKVRPSTHDLFIEITGTDLLTVNRALSIITSSLAERGAKVFEVSVYYGKDKRVCPDFAPDTMVLSADYCRSLIGELIPSRSIPVLLRKMGFGVERDGDSLSVSIPCYRTDVMHPMDLVEDVAIAYGYGNFEPVVPKVFGIAKENVLCSRYEFVNDLFVSFGFIEVYNWLLTGRGVLFDKMVVKPHGVVEILHPKTEDLSVCRDSLMPQLIEFLGKNKHNDYPQNIFELGDVMVLNGGVVNESKHLGVVIAHSKASYSELKAIIDSLFADLSVKVIARPSDKPSLISGRSAELVYKGCVIGFIGELHPQVLANYDLKVPVVVCELDIKEILK